MTKIEQAIVRRGVRAWIRTCTPRYHEESLEAMQSDMAALKRLRDLVGTIDIDDARALAELSA